MRKRYEFWKCIMTPMTLMIINDFLKLRQIEYIVRQGARSTGVHSALNTAELARLIYDIMTFYGIWLHPTSNNNQEDPINIKYFILYASHGLINILSFIFSQEFDSINFLNFTVISYWADHFGFNSCPKPRNMSFIISQHIPLKVILSCDMLPAGLM